MAQSMSAAANATCLPGEHAHTPIAVDDVACERAADIFRALGDTSRLRLLSMLIDCELCVTDLAARLDDNLPAVSQRLKVLKSERIVAVRRHGKHMYYSLADGHVAALIKNGLEHAGH